MAKRKRKKQEEKSKTFHRRIIILIGFIATFLSFFITSTGLFRGLENRSIDWRFKQRGVIKPEAPIVIVAIDDESFAKMPERWTWPRNFYGKVVNNLKKWGAKVIAFDVIYSEPTTKNPEEDKIFADALKKAKNVILGMAILEISKNNLSMQKAVFPIDILRKNAYSLGIIHHAFDNDTHIRKSILFLNYNDKKYYSLSIESLGLYYGLNKKDIKITDKYLLWGEKIKIPLYKKNGIIINYAGPPSTFKTIPFYKVYYGEDIDKKLFKNKIVLIGSTAEILHDVFLTPFSEPGVMMPGVEIHANVLNTIFTNNYMNQMTETQSILLMLGIGILTSFLIFAVRAWQGLLISLIEITVFTIFSIYIFNTHNYIITFINPLFTIFFCYLSISTYKVAVEEREKKKIKNIFSKYVSKNLVEELLKSQEIKLGGERKEVTVLFSDIRGFTSMSEKMEPEEVVSLLNEYLSTMTDIIFKNRGTLDKFIGDAIMAIFGTPIYYKDHAIRAVKTAIMMRGKLNELNAKWRKEGKKTLRIGIGINTGEVIAGNMGSVKRMEYTVIGDTVNLASRLESLNKELGTEILISENTYKYVKDHVKVKEYSNIKIRGKEKSIKVYEVIEFMQ